LQQEEVGTAVEELHGEGAGRRSPDGVVGAADAQDRDGCFIHLPERVVAIPVSVPGDRVPLGLAKEGFLEFPERAAPEQPACLHNLCQRGGIPRRDKGNRQGRSHMERLCPCHSPAHRCPLLDAIRFLKCFTLETRVQRLP
uniref:Uncharacterized protein n=1 Tax=Terrapene triunguis TaxID=2587831 RepID=A0A674INH4_9SAUR